MTSGVQTDSGRRILGFLRRVDRRLSLNDSLKRIARGLWVLVALLVVLRIAGVWESAAARNAVILLYFSGLAGFVAWRYLTAGALGRAAAVADREADLKDALKSALAFIGLADRSRWMDFQIERTAVASEPLSPSEVAPTVLPRPLWYAAGTGVLLATLFTWNPGWLQELEEAEFLALGESGESERISELLEETEALAPEMEQLEELEQALERLRERDVELSESLRDLEDAQEALAASRTDMERLEMDLEEMAGDLETVPGMTELSEALRAHDTEAAAELLRELAERLGEAQSSEELQALLEALANADIQQTDLAELMEGFEAGELSEQSLAEMAKALEQAAAQLEQMGQQMAGQMPQDQMGQQLSELQAQMGQQQAPGQQQMGQQQQQQAGGQAMQTAAGSMTQQMQMAQMQGDPSSAVPVDAGPAGDTTGPGGGGDEQVFGEATTLDVQLEMEVLKTEERDEPIPEEIFERLSREEKSTLNYEAVQRRGRYAEEDVLAAERVPWQYRALVKRYFLSLLSRSQTNTETGSEK